MYKKKTLLAIFVLLALAFTSCHKKGCPTKFEVNNCSIAAPLATL
jgi:hypothetical protein